MLRNYLRVAFRNLTRNRFSSAINIGGLAVGMSVAILIGLWVFEEFSYDRSIPNHDRIAAVMQNQVASERSNRGPGEGMAGKVSILETFFAGGRGLGANGTFLWNFLRVASPWIQPF